MMLDIPQEKADGREAIDAQNWPKEGKIEFKNVCLRYRENTDIVLKELSFAVEAGLNVGIVGRTGAGKSTTSIALARIVELEGG